MLKENSYELRTDYYFLYKRLLCTYMYTVIFSHYHFNIFNELMLFSYPLLINPNSNGESYSLIVWWGEGD